MANSVFYTINICILFVSHIEHVSYQFESNFYEHLQI